MEHILRCNSLKCRKELNDQAVVTTCSHIFCLDCSDQCQLSVQGDGQRAICPACDMRLTNPDDVVVANLNPTEDYKTSVLSGLSPNVVIECAGRALSFWAYQTTQEIIYQQYLAENLTEKYTTLKAQMDQIIRDANAEISNLRNKVSSTHIDQESLRRKNEELFQAFREKSRKQLQTQELYDKLKRRALLGQVQDAASDAVDHAIQASITSNRLSNQSQGPSQLPALPNLQASSIRDSTPATFMGSTMTPRVSRSVTDHTRLARFSNRDTVYQNQPFHTPSTHRQRLLSTIPLSPRTRLDGPQTNSTGETPIPQRRMTPSRQPFTSLSGNITGAPATFAGYGMSAGLKVSNPTGIALNEPGRPMMSLSAVPHLQTQVRHGAKSAALSQRSGPRFPTSRTSSFGLTNFLANEDGYF